MVFIVTGSGVRTAESIEGELAAAPTLHLEYLPAGGPANTAPQVEAGPDLVVDLTGLPGQLAGFVHDDGLPWDTLTVAWSQLDGPGTAVFGDGADPATTVDFDLPGTYLLQLAADDGEYLESDTVTVLVTDLDLDPPTVPEWRSARVVAPERILLAWTACTDDTAMAGYVIYRNGEPYVRVEQPWFSDVNVVHGLVYEYEVAAYDPAGNHSARSLPARVWCGPVKGMPVGVQE
jgi:hypothetical protein